jgi:thiamine biosynthesis protein ThiS
MITITVNGEQRTSNPGSTVTELLQQMGLDPGRVAIERNLEILSRPHWQKTVIQAGDRYEIVQFVGGG